MSFTSKMNLIILSLIITVSFTVNGQVIRYVTVGGAGSGDGTTWDNAYAGSNLQTAIDEAGVTEVWVAAGTYLPGTLRSNSFQLKSGVAIYGGFSGTETLLSERDIYNNQTILSGDLDGDDVITGTGATLSITNNTENCYHVVYNTGSVDATAVLDGFTIRGGNANDGGYPNDTGGGIYNSDSSPTIINCTVTGNHSITAGGGISAENGSSVAMINCLVINNINDSYGGGIYVLLSSPILSNCTIYGNSSFYGGGIYAEESSTLNNSIIWGNIVQDTGEGNQVYVFTTGIVTLNYSCYSNGANDVVNFGTFTATNHNTTSDPSFADVSAGDYRIFADSPCADTGDDSYNSETTDIRGPGFDRKLNKTTGAAGTIDMGAYECKADSDPVPMTLYVTPAGAGSADGTSWANAYAGSHLQTAINYTGVTDVWVAAGTYKPTTTADMSICFQMKSHVAVYGGFDGTETLLSERDFVSNVTILSGDLDGDDVVSGSGAALSITGYEENSNHVIYNSGVNSTAILDGFTITGGYANDDDALVFGGGVCNINSSPALSNCIITGNTSEWIAGGIYNSGSSPMLTNCTISKNLVVEYNGGGMANEEASSPTLTNCLISGNSAPGTDTGDAGAISNQNSAVILTNCTIAGNYGYRYGGAFEMSGDSRPMSITLNNSILWGNAVHGPTSHGRQVYVWGGTLSLNSTCFAYDQDYSIDSCDIYIDPNGREAGNGGVPVLSIDGSSITTDPEYADPAAGDYRIYADSPCADAGDDSYNSETTDIRGPGYDRKLNKTSGAAGTIDMGAYEFNLAVDINITLDLTVFLEGAFDTGTSLMETTLKTEGFMPLTQPYNTAPWNYTGTEAVASIPADVVDWVLVELRDAASAAEAVSATVLAGWPKAFFLKADGSIVDVDGTSLPGIGNPTITNSLYVVVRHRNHLAVMSSAGMSLSSGVYSYDFTTGLDQAYGGSSGYKQAGDKYVMVGGDITHDGNIYVTDYNAWAVAFGTTDGYYKSDLNMDGDVYVTDYNLWAANFGSTADTTIKSGLLNRSKYFSCVPD